MTEDHVTAIEKFLQDTLDVLRKAVDKVSHFEQSPSSGPWGRRHYWIVPEHKGDMGREECVMAGGRCAYEIAIE